MWRIRVERAAAADDADAFGKDRERAGYVGYYRSGVGYDHGRFGTCFGCIRCSVVKL